MYLCDFGPWPAGLYKIKFPKKVFEVTIYASKEATGLYIYKPVDGAGASCCMILSMLHIRNPFSKLRNTYT